MVVVPAVLPRGVKAGCVLGLLAVEDTRSSLYGDSGGIGVPMWS